MMSNSKKSALTLLSEVLRDPERKSGFKMMYEIFELLIYHKRLPRHYFSKYLFKKNITNIKDYYTEHFLYYKLKPFFNERAVRDVVENKLYFDFFYRQFNVPLPKIIMYNHRKTFVKGNESFEINNVNDFSIVMVRIFEKKFNMWLDYYKKNLWKSWS